MNVNPGDLKARITIARLTKTKDADGYYSSEYSNVLSCRAKFSRVSGTEVFKAGADFTQVEARFLIRYRKGVDRKMVVLYDGAEYEIKYVNDYDDRREYMEIWATRLTTEAEI